MAVLTRIEGMAQAVAPVRHDTRAQSPRPVQTQPGYCRSGRLSRVRIQPSDEKTNRVQSPAPGASQPPGQRRGTRDDLVCRCDRNLASQLKPSIPEQYAPTADFFRPDN